jgi:predicted NAD/FAD-binding protein
MKNIAVVGAGISGLAPAALLSRRHRVDGFEHARRLGGHTTTVLFDGPKGTVALSPVECTCAPWNGRSTAPDGLGPSQAER